MRVVFREKSSDMKIGVCTSEQCYKTLKERLDMEQWESSWQFPLRDKISTCQLLNGYKPFCNACLEHQAGFFFRKWCLFLVLHNADSTL